MSWLSVLGAVLLVNGGFDHAEPAERWNLPNGWRIAVGEGRNGSNALEWKNDDPEHYTFPVQNIPVEPFAVYRFKGRAKIMEGKDLKPRIAIDFSDANGKYLGSCQAYPTVDNDPNANGWVTYYGVSRALPAEVASGHFLCYLHKPSVGRVLFDDFELELMPEKPLDRVYSSAYRDQFSDADGDLRILASLRLNTLRRPLSAYACEFEYPGSDGKLQVVQAPKLKVDQAEIRLPTTAFAVGKTTVKARVSVDGRPVGEAQLELVKTREPLKRRSYIDRGGRLVVDGKRVFPLGFYTYQPTEQTAQDWRGTPFNFCVQYGRVTSDDLDAWQRLGILVAPDVRQLIYGYNYGTRSRCATRAESLAAVKEIVAKLGAHPALAAWYIVDEVPESLMENVADVNRMFRELDSDHPTYAVTDKPYDTRALMPCADVFGMDPYPIGGWKRDLTICSGWGYQCREGMFDLKPMWHVPQTFNWSWYRKEQVNDPAVRMPTAAEMANMTWQGIAAGANGICNYGYHSLRRNLPEAEFAQRWAEIVGIAREIRQVEAVLLDEDVPLRQDKQPETLAVRVFRHQGEIYLLVVNRTDRPVTESLPLPREYAALEFLLGAGPRLNGKELAVELAPLGYAFLKLKDK